MHHRCLTRRGAVRDHAGSPGDIRREHAVALVGVGEVRISAHGYDELAEDDILAGEVIDGVEAAVLIEEYPTYAKGPCVLVLQRDGSGSPVHVVWGIPRARHRRPC
jgi:hypothetical protein